LAQSWKVISRLISLRFWLSNVFIQTSFVSQSFVLRGDDDDDEQSVESTVEVAKMETVVDPTDRHTRVLQL